MGSSWHPSWVQLGSEWTFSSHSNSEFVSQGIVERLGLDLGSLSGSKIEPKTDLKIRGVQSVKFDSRVDGSSIFEVPGRSKIDKETM